MRYSTDYVQMGHMFSIIIKPYSIKMHILISTHLKLCLATATHNFKWVKITPLFNLRPSIYKWWCLTLQSRLAS